VQKGWLKHVTIYLNKPIDSLPVRLIGFLQAHSSIRKSTWQNKSFGKWKLFIISAEWFIKAVFKTNLKKWWKINIF